MNKAQVCRAPWWAIGLLLALPGFAFAQAGGSYCVGPTYLAYDVVRSGAVHSAPGLPTTPHSLHVLPIAPDGAIGAVRGAPLPDFTVHGMQCLEMAVRVLGWDSLYTLPVTPAALGALTGEPAPWSGQGPSRAPLPAFPDSTLWHGWNLGVDTVRLPLTAGQATWILVIEARASHPDMCEYRVVTRLVRLPTTRRPAASALVYDSIRSGECGE